MHRLLALSIVAVLGLGLAALVSGAAEPPPAVPSGGEEPSAGSITGASVLGPDQVEATGRLTSLRAVAERSGDIPTPFAVDVPERGRGGATITAAIVDGQRAAIVWGAPSPLRVSGAGGALLPGRAVVHAGVDLRWELDHAVHGFRPGTYRIDSPVAVGTSALATPRDSVEFVADDRTTLTTNDGAFVSMSPRPIRLEGPGELAIEGELEVRTAAGTTTPAALGFGPGSYVVELLPVAGAWGLELVATGPVAPV